MSIDDIFEEFAFSLLRQAERRVTALRDRLDAGPGALADPAPRRAPGLAPGPVTGLAATGPSRIRTGHSYHVPFKIDLGQRNARFVARAITPLARHVTSADAVSFVPEPGFDAIHAWNAAPLLTRRPFILTFEDFMPRTPTDRRIGWLERRLRDRLLDDRCVALVAFSRYALRQFRWQHRDFARLPDRLAKTELIYPATPLRREGPQAGDRPAAAAFRRPGLHAQGWPPAALAQARRRRGPRGEKQRPDPLARPPRLRQRGPWAASPSASPRPRPGSGRCATAPSCLASSRRDRLKRP